MNFDAIEKFVAEKLGSDGTGHDVYHCLRVRQLAERLATLEGSGDLIVIACAALLHDVPDPKICSNSDTAKREIITLMESNGIEADRVRHIVQIIDTLSFKGAHVETPMETIEGKIVQDADRLDAIGAIGIARCFAYGGSRGNILYDPLEHPVLHNSEAEYRAHHGSSFAHFHEKLLLLKDRMQTEAGRRIAANRHQYMVGFLRQFLDEWELKDTSSVLPDIALSLNE
jgi:uncharacterized protein